MLVIYADTGTIIAGLPVLDKPVIVYLLTEKKENLHSIQTNSLCHYVLFLIMKV